MTIQVFPSSPVPEFEYPLKSEFNTLVSEFDSGIEQRRQLRRFPKRTVSLNFNYLTEADRKILQNFFQQRFGSFEAFWFVDPIKRNWVDEYVGRGTWASMVGAVADDGGVQTDETIASNDATANDMTLLPAVPAVNDAYCFGAADPFDLLRIQIGTAGAGTWTIVWEYYNGSTWASPSNVSDGSNGFRNSGAQDIKFDRPSDWAKTTVKTISAYWLRARVSAYTSITTQPKGTQSWLAIRQYDLHSKTTTVGALKIYIDGVLKTGGGTDYAFISGGGEAAVDRIRFVSAPASGALITSDFEGYLRIKGRFRGDAFGETMKAPLLFSHQAEIYEVQW